MEKSTIFKCAVTVAGLLTARATFAQNFTQQQQPFQCVVGKTLADSKESWTAPIKAPKGAPQCGMDYIR